MQVVGEAQDGEEAVKTTLRTQPDLVLLDIRMPRQNGIEATRLIHAALPKIKVILLTTFDIQEYVYDGIRAGAVGYILKDAQTRDLLDGIRAANQGAVVFRSSVSGAALARAVNEPRRLDVNGDQNQVLFEPLTERELQVLQQMAYGKRNAEIAIFLSVSEGTVKTHVHRVLQKLGVDDRTQAVVIALRSGLVQ